MEQQTTKLQSTSILIFSFGGVVMFQEEGYQLMGAAFEVYNYLGYGMAEEIYQQSLEIELSLRKIQFRSKYELPAYYKDHLLVTCYRPDLLELDAIVVELKAVSEVISDHEAQLFNYMRVARQPVGYLINFGKKGDLEWKRFILSDVKHLERNTNPR